MSALAIFADELEQLAGTVDGKRFRGADPYVVDMDELRRRLRDMADRMRREASVPAPERLALSTARRAVSAGREVRIEHRRRRTIRPQDCFR